MRYMTRIIIVIIFLPVVAMAKEADVPPWSVARRVMQECYGGWDIEVIVSAGYETRYYQDGPVSGPTANAMFSVPLYSRKERISRQERTNKQIEHLAELYAEMETHLAIINSLSSEKDILKKVMIDSGQEGIKAYYDLLQEMERSKTKVNTAKRKIIMILENCGYVETDKITGP